MKSIALGLTSEAAQAQLMRVGPNEIAERSHLVVLDFFAKFKSPLVIVLMGAAVLSALFGDWTSALLIIIIVLASGILDFVNTYRAHHAAELLREKVKITTAVYRNGKVVELPVRDVVPEDVIRLLPGDIVPADGTVLEAQDFFVNESSLTGESFPAAKPEGENVFMGSSVVTGSANVQVNGTGAKTKFGSIVAAVSAKDLPTQFDREIRDFSYLVIRIMFVMVIVVFAVNVVARHSLFESLLFAVALAVGLTPELLPMIITLNLTKGSLVMAKHGVIVKRLSAIQNCGSMDILCTDKTGTLTEDRIELVRYVDGEGKEADDVLLYSYVSGSMQTGMKSPLDEAILKHRHPSVQEFTKVQEIPFDFERRRDSVVVRRDGAEWLVTKGAPEDVLAVCTRYRTASKTFTVAARRRAEKEYAELSAAGFRVLAVAVKKISAKKANYTHKEEEALTLLGFAAFLDPPKESVSETIRFLEQHGIEVKIITGDSDLVTKKIADDIKFPVKGILLGPEIAGMTDAALRAQADRHTIFARVTPDQKMRVIKALQAAGHGVGYLGDGINDAPSLKQADVGISVNNAVDVAKQSADLILMHKSLRDLGNGVIEGRRTFVNTLKYLMMELSSNFGNMFSMAAASFFIPFFPMLPLQILFNNLLYDTSQFALPLDHVDAIEIRQPRRFRVDFLRSFMLVFGPLSSCFDFLTFILLLAVFHLSPSGFQTSWFIESLATQTFIVFAIRTRHFPFWKSKPARALIFSAIAVVAVGVAVAVSPLGAVFSFTPPPWPVLASIVGIVIFYVLVVDTLKTKLYRGWQNTNGDPGL